MKSRILLIFNILLVASLLLAGCAQPTATTAPVASAPTAAVAAPTNPPAAQKVTITLQPGPEPTSRRSCKPSSTR